MSVSERLSDVTEIQSFLRGDPGLHIYEIGDLDPFFFPHTRWWGARIDGALQALVLLYDGGAAPSLLALERDQIELLGELFAALEDELPDRFYAHVSPELSARCEQMFDAEPYGRHFKMLLQHPERAADADVEGVERFDRADVDELLAFYETAYPGNWFDARMLETGQYYGVRDNERLVSVAGIHVYSAAHGVAALGNIATHPNARRRGLGRRTTARLCQSLLEDVETVGLNVKADNDGAIRCYEQLGFEVVAEYDEWLLQRGRVRMS